jgi:hypothetical protein
MYKTEELYMNSSFPFSSFSFYFFKLRDASDWNSKALLSWSYEALLGCSMSYKKHIFQ